MQQVGMVAFRPRIPALSVVEGASSSDAQRRPSRSDDEILSALRRGDTRVADDFYWRVKPVVDRTVRRLLGRLDRDGEDLVQIALVELIESVTGYRGDCPLDAWVSAVSAHVVYKHIRRRRLERSIFAAALEDDEEIAIGPRSSTVETASLREALRQIGVHLGAMSSDRAWAFLLHDVCGYSLDEVAHICGVSVVAAQSRLVRGRRDIHDKIAADPRLAAILDRGGS
ncbi:MAG TPA: RNA polymerase sigma factor [Polyangia bacterium]|nr:RNA polymerase sigma factor [Polyangia bacterium]